MRNVILYIAMSLDGFIAGEHDDLSFLNDYDGLDLVNVSYGKLLTSIDTILLGRKTYDWVISHMTWPYDGLHTIVFSNSPKRIDHGLMTNQKPKDIVHELKEKPGKDIWLIGGGKLVQSMLKDDLIDEMMIAIIPKLLGSGIRLFEGSSSSWKLMEFKEESGLILLTYKKNDLA